MWWEFIIIYIRKRREKASKNSDGTLQLMGLHSTLTTIIKLAQIHKIFLKRQQTPQKLTFDQEKQLIYNL